MAIKIENLTVRVNKHEAVEEVILSSQSPRFDLPLYFTDEAERGKFESGATYRMELIKVEAAPPAEDVDKGKAAKK